MVCGCVIKYVKDKNILIPEDGISKEQSPRVLITGIANPSYNDIQKLNFGDYVQVFNPHNITNTNEPRTTGAIALYPSDNAQGGWYFMSLDTGKRIHRYQWKVLPATKEILSRVDTIAQNLVANHFKFQWNQNSEHISDEDEGDEESTAIHNLHTVMEELPPPPLPLSIEDMSQDDLHQENNHTNENESGDTENDIEVVDGEEQIEDNIDNNGTEQEMMEQAVEDACHDADMQNNDDD